MPQFLAAISLKFAVPAILARLGYQACSASTPFSSNWSSGSSPSSATQPMLVVALPAVAFGYVSSLQYASMNTLVYATSASATRHGQQHRRAVRRVSMGSGPSRWPRWPPPCSCPIVPGHPPGDDVGHPRRSWMLGLLHGPLGAHLPSACAPRTVPTLSRHLPLTHDGLAAASASSHRGGLAVPRHHRGSARCRRRGCSALVVAPA